MTELMLDEAIIVEGDGIAADALVDESFSEEYMGLMKHKKELELLENVLWHHYMLSEDKPQIEEEVCRMIKECQNTMAEIDYVLSLIELSRCE
jgi:hypothetical protein